MMANRSQQHRKFVQLKLDFLEQQRSHVHDVVDTYVNKVVDKTKGWLDNTGDQQLTSQDLNQLIDSAVMFLVDKATQIQEDEETVETETTETEMSPSLKTQKTTSTDLPLSLASRSGDGGTQELVARLETLEKTVSSLHTKGEELENLSAKQAEMGEQLAQLKTDQSAQSENIEDISSQISSMENNQQIRIKKLKTKIGDVTKNLETARKSQRTMIADVEEKVDSLSEKMEEIKDNIVKDLDGQMKTLSGQVAEIKEEISDGDKKLGDEIRAVENKLSDKVIEVDVATEELSEKMDKIQEMDQKKMKQLENKLLAVKRRRKLDFKKVETRYDNVELQYKMVCSIVADRLLGLERLRDILNKKIMSRNQTDSNTNEETDSNNMEGPARDQMVNTTLPVTGFKAHTRSRPRYNYANNITKYSRVETNHGGHFNPDTGKYTVPADGRYRVTFSTDHQDGYLNLELERVSGKGTNFIFICNNQSSVLHKGLYEKTHECVLNSGNCLYLRGESYVEKGVSVHVRFSVSHLE